MEGQHPESFEIVMLKRNNICTYLRRPFYTQSRPLQARSRCYPHWTVLHEDTLSTTCGSSVSTCDIREKYFVLNIKSQRESIVGAERYIEQVQENNCISGWEGGKRNCRQIIVGPLVVFIANTQFEMVAVRLQVILPAKKNHLQTRVSSHSLVISLPIINKVPLLPWGWMKRH